MKTTQRIVVIETLYGCVDAEMDDDRYVYDNVFADHFKTMAEAEEYAREANRTRSMAGGFRIAPLSGSIEGEQEPRILLDNKVLLW